MRTKLFLGSILTVVLFIGIARAGTTSHLISLQGYVRNKSTGDALSSGDLRVKIYDASSGGSLIYDSSTTYDNEIDNGVFDVLLGSQVSLELDDTIKYWLELSINTETVDLNSGSSVRQDFWAGGGNHTHTHDASDITSGTLSNDRLSNIPASKINTTELDADTLDGQNSSEFASDSHNHSFTCEWKYADDTDGSVTVTCSAGYTLFSGGCDVGTGEYIDMFFPYDVSESYECTLKDSGNVRAYAKCCKI